MKKLCMVYSPFDSKLIHRAYCSVFRDMFEALIEQFNCKQFVTEDIDAEKIDADIIFFFDPHATHHIEIKGIEKHPALKVEYWNDVNQTGGTYNFKSCGRVRKLSPPERAERAKRRGTRYIITAAKYLFLDTFNEHFGNDIEKMLVHFPHAPKDPGKLPEWEDRKTAVLGNGATQGARNGGYDFRAWAFEQPYIEHVPHCVQDGDTPKGSEYIKFLSQYKAALALCSGGPVPKYSEIPMAGCLMFAEPHKELDELWFKDGANCLMVKKREDLKRLVNAFHEEPDLAKEIAEAGQKLMRENYTAKHFAYRVYSLCG